MPRKGTDAEHTPPAASGIARPRYRQRSPEWYAERRTGIGSSDAPVIAGISPYSDARTLWLQKVGLAPEAEQNEPMRWGRLLEAAIAQGYTEMTGNPLRRLHKIRRSREYPWMLASIDRAIVGRPRRRRRLVEIKTVRFKKDDWGRAGSDDVPDPVRVQVQHQMIVTGYREADVAVLFSGSDLQVYSLGWDQRLAEGLIGMEVRFWQYVESRTPPPVVTQQRVMPRSDVVEADGRVQTLVGEIAAYRAEQEEAKSHRDAAEAQLKEAIAEETVLVGPGFTVTYRPGRDRVKVAWEEVARAYRHLLTRPDADYPPEEEDLDTIEGLYTRTEPGTRPLIIKFETGGSDAPPRLG